MRERHTGVTGLDVIVDLADLVGGLFDLPIWLTLVLLIAFCACLVKFRRPEVRHE